MPKLLELQMQLRDAVLGGAGSELLAEIKPDGLPPETRVRIYRNHAVSTLGAVLESVFPVVCRLVDRRFFVYAAHEYLRGHAPHSRCLAEYGADFADFLAGFGPCKELPYLPDLARFEWALKAAATMREAPPLAIEDLAAAPLDGAASLKISLQPSVRYFASSWPIDVIWLGNQQQEVPSMDLAVGGASLELRRADEGVVWRQLDAASFVFRSALADGLALGVAATAAAAADAGFDLSVALDTLFAEGLAVGLGAC